MGGINQIAPLSGPMNDTVHGKYIKTSDGEVLSRLNMKPNLNGSRHTNTCINGTLLIETQLPAGNNTCIGWCNDPESKAIVYFIYNSLYNHSIFRYFIKTKTIQRIIYADYELNLTENSTVKAQVVEGRLYWVDDNDMPKSLDLNMAYNYTAEATTTTTTASPTTTTTTASTTTTTTTGATRYYEVTLYTCDTCVYESSAEFFSTVERVVGHYYGCGDGFSYLVTSEITGPGPVFDMSDFVDYGTDCASVPCSTTTTAAPTTSTTAAPTTTSTTDSGALYKYTEADRPFAENIYPLIKKPPRFGPSVSYETVEEFNSLPIAFNNIRGKLFQFKYNYAYTGNQESAYSPISKVPLPVGEINADSTWAANQSLNNSISVIINTGGRDVRKINIAARDASNLNNGAFYVFYTIEKYDSSGNRIVADNIDMPVSFLNNAQYKSIDTDYGNAYFHDVPLIARDILLLDGKYLAMAYPDKNYDKPTMDYRLGTSLSDVSNSYQTSQWQKEVGYASKLIGWFDDPCEVWWLLYLPSEITYNSTYRVVAQKDGESWSGEVSIGATYAGSYPEDVRDALKTALEADGFTGYLEARGSDGLRVGYLKVFDSEGNSECPNYDISNAYGLTVTSTEASTSAKSLKKGQYHPFGIIYNDKFGRYNVVNIDEAHSELYASYGTLNSSTYFSKKIVPSWKIFNQPPIEARSYRWCYLRNRSYSYFISLPRVFAVAEGTRTYFNVNEAILNYNSIFPKSVLETYEFVNGDRMKIFTGKHYYPETTTTTAAPATTTTTSPTGVVVPEIYDLEIIGEKFDTDGTTSLGFLVEGAFDPTDLGVDGEYDLYHIEIYRPNKTPQLTTFLEIGEEFEVLDYGTDSRRHQGGSADQVLYPGVKINWTIDASLCYVDSGVQKIKVLKSTVQEAGISDSDFLATTHGYVSIANNELSVETNYTSVSSFDSSYYSLSMESLLPTNIFSVSSTAAAEAENIQVAAEGIMDFGDVYIRERMIDGINAEFVEDANYSDFYVSSAIDVGRLGANIESERKRLNRVVRGENYLENTETNNLNIFLPQAEYLDLSDRYGQLIGIEEAGDVLKVIQEHKETSVYVGKNYAKDAGGGNILLETDRTFGSFNRYDEFIGCSYRKSLVSNNRYLYYFDEMAGDLIRSSPNGLLSLGMHYNMQSFFDRKSKELRETTSHKDVIVGINNPNEVYVIFIIGSTVETIVFSEDEANKGFLFFVDLYNNTSKPEQAGWLGETMVLFSGGSLYLYNEGNDNEFFGSEKKAASISFMANQNPFDKKIFENIEIGSSKDWSAVFEIEANNEYPHGQKSVLSQYLFKKQSGGLNSAVLRNIVKRNGEEDVTLLYQGNKMAGEEMRVTLSCSDLAELSGSEIRATIENL